MADPRLVSQKILIEFFKKKKPLNVIVANTSASLNSAEIQRIHALTRDVVRWKGRLDYWIDSALDRPISTLDPSLKILLRSAVFELMMDETVPDYAAINSWVKIARKSIGEKVTGITNAVLRSLSKIDASKPLSKSLSGNVLADWLSFPDWILKRWISTFGRDSAVELCESLNASHEYTIRVNTATLSMEEIIERCEEDGIQLNQIISSSQFFKVKSGFSTLRRHPLFLDGSISIQDRAAGIAVELLDPKPGEIVLDVCAAPGTKALYMAEMMKDSGRILASDSDSTRVELGKNDLARHGSKSIEWETKNAITDDYEMADAVLIDAPCTGTGVIAKHPDIKWRQAEKNISEMSILQLDILKHVSTFVKPGGRLVYSTCSLEPEENWKVVEAFLKLNPTFSMDMKLNGLQNQWADSHGTIQTLPHRDKTDGMFAARMMKS